MKISMLRLLLACGDIRVAIDDQSEIDHIVTYSNTTLTSTIADNTHQSKENTPNIDDGLRKNNK